MTDTNQMSTADKLDAVLAELEFLAKAIDAGDEQGGLQLRIGDICGNIRKAKNHCDRPLELIINCPECGGRHIDEGEFADKVHHTHACQHCGFVWRPSVGPTKGVQFLKGFKND